MLDLDNAIFTGQNFILDLKEELQKGRVIQPLTRRPSARTTFSRIKNELPHQVLITEIASRLESKADIIAQIKGTPSKLLQIMSTIDWGGQATVGIHAPDNDEFLANASYRTFLLTIAALMWNKNESYNNYHKFDTPDVTNQVGIVITDPSINLEIWLGLGNMRGLTPIFSGRLRPNTSMVIYTPIN
jgi:hypothetical protein